MGALRKSSREDQGPKLIQLPKGEIVSVRTAARSDANRADLFFAGLSAGTRYNRFFSFVNQPPEEWARQFTHEEFSQEISMIATVGSSGRETIVGNIQCVRSDNPLKAEFALLIADTWQNKGLGGRLLCHLEEIAHEHGIEDLYCSIHLSNRRMCHLACKAGFKIVSCFAACALFEKRL
jgi:acetyltransferase